MAGITDKPFRQLCKRLGAGLATTEMTTSDPRLWQTRQSLHAHGWRNFQRLSGKRNGPHEQTVSSIRTDQNAADCYWQPANLNDPMRVLQLNEPFACRYSFVYQNVQSSTGSIDMAL